MTFIIVLLMTTFSFSTLWYKFLIMLLHILASRVPICVTATCCSFLLFTPLRMLLPWEMTFNSLAKFKYFYSARSTVVKYRYMSLSSWKFGIHLLELPIENNNVKRLYSNIILRVYIVRQKLFIVNRNIFLNKYYLCHLSTCEIQIATADQFFDF